MKMSIDESERYLRLMLGGMKYVVKYWKDRDVEAIETAIDTMHKYRKIQEIINNAKDSDGAVKYNWLYEQIREVAEDGNDI